MAKKQSLILKGLVLGALLLGGANGCVSGAQEMRDEMATTCEARGCTKADAKLHYKMATTAGTKAGDKIRGDRRRAGHGVLVNGVRYDSEGSRLIDSATVATSLDYYRNTIHPQTENCHENI